MTVLRFNGVERAFHWTFALIFLALLGTGLALEHPDLRGIPFYGSKLVREVHLTLALLLLCLPALAASWDGFASVRAMLRAALAFRAADSAWLRALGGHLVGRGGEMPPQGRFNAGQKLNAYLTILATVGLALSGVLIAPLHGPIPQAWRELLYQVHTVLAYAIIPLVAVHIGLALVWPPTRPALSGMLSGRVAAAWARRHHAAWLADVQDGRSE